MLSKLDIVYIKVIIYNKVSELEVIFDQDYATESED
jgi:hypothetical protein